VEAAVIELIKIKEEEEKEKKRVGEEEKRAMKTSVNKQKGGAPQQMMGPTQGQLDLILQQMKKGQGLRRQTNVTNNN